MDQHQLSRRRNLSSYTFLIATTLALTALQGGAQTGTPALADPPTAPQPQAQAQSAPLSQAASAQGFVVKDYSKPHPAFPNVLAPYIEERVPPPNLKNTPRIDQLLKDGKIMLSMDDAVALALENNLDIGIARYNLSIADTDILRTRAGALLLGVNTGVLQGTPGGGVGGLSGIVGSGAGGTSLAPGGAATGTAGLVSSTLGLGSSISSYDPILGATLEIDRAKTLSASSLFGATQINLNTDTANFNYAQGFQWGTNMLLTFNNSHLTTNQPTIIYSPQLNSNFKLELSQHLLQGFGSLPNTRFIRIAKNNRLITDIAFKLQVITTVDQIENIYWDLVYAYENLKVQRDALAFAQKTLSDTEKQVKAGVTAPLQLASAQSAVSADQEVLIVAQTNLELQQLLMKNALSKTVEDPVVAEAEVIPTSTMEVPENEQIPPARDLIEQALKTRGELAESRVDLANREISARAITNALRPTVDAFVYYGGSGLGGDQNPANICLPSGKPFGCHEPGTIASVSYGETLQQLVNSTAPDKGGGVTLTIPIRNRVAQANQIRSELEHRQAEMRLQQLENQVGIEVRNAQFTLLQNRAAVAAAKAGVEYAEQSLRAEQRKLAVGISTAVLVLQNESLLTTAQSNLISAMANYEKSRLELDRSIGLLLEHSNIQIADAKRGLVTESPHVPDVVPKQEVTSEPQQQR